MSEDTVRRRIIEGVLPAIQLGGGSSIRIDERELDHWLYGIPRDAA